MTVSSEAETGAAVSRPSNPLAGSVDRSMRRVSVPRAASCASAYSTSTRDLDVADGLPEMPTTRIAVASLTQLPPGKNSIGRDPSEESRPILVCSASQRLGALWQDLPLPLATHECRPTTPQGQCARCDHRRATYSRSSPSATAFYQSPVQSCVGSAIAISVRVERCLLLRTVSDAAQPPNPSGPGGPTT